MERVETVQIIARRYREGAFLQVWRCRFGGEGCKVESENVIWIADDIIVEWDQYSGETVCGDFRIEIGINIYGSENGFE